MKQSYKLSDGKIAEIEVNSAVAELLANFKREDENAARKYRSRKEVSIEAMKEETGWEPTDTTVNIEAEYIAREEKQILLASLMHLSDKQRRLIQLYYYDEKNFTEIAAILGINRRSVSKQLETIHKKLKIIFD